MTKPYPKKQKYSKEQGCGYMFYSNDKEYVDAYNNAHEELTEWFLEKLKELSMQDVDNIYFKIQDVILEIKGDSNGLS